MELTKNDTKITSKEAEQNLNKSSIEWVEKELSTGIELPAHYWKYPLCADADCTGKSKKNRKLNDPRANSNLSVNNFLFF